MRRLRAVLRRPTSETWGAACSIIINERGTTLWQAVRRIDPSFPVVGPAQGEAWERVPDLLTIARAMGWCDFASSV